MGAAGAPGRQGPRRARFRVLSGGGRFGPTARERAARLRDDADRFLRVLLGGRALRPFLGGPGPDRPA